jgi:hypothetical protein
MLRPWPEGVGSVSEFIPWEDLVVGQIYEVHDFTTPPMIIGVGELVSIKKARGYDRDDVWQRNQLEFHVALMDFLFVRSSLPRTGNDRRRISSKDGKLKLKPALDLPFYTDLTITIRGREMLNEAR